MISRAFRRFQAGRVKPFPRVLAVLGVAAIVAAVTIVGFLRASQSSHAAPLASEQCKFVILPGHSDTKSLTYADGDTVTVHSQLYEYMDTVTHDFCGELESITTISDNGHGAPVFGSGGDELVYRLSTGQYTTVAAGTINYSNSFPPLSIIETTTCAAPGGEFSPRDGEPTITTGAANYCPPQ